MQATILKIMGELGDNASGSKANEELILETGERFESSFIYVNIKKRPTRTISLSSQQVHDLRLTVGGRAPV